MEDDVQVLAPVPDPLAPEASAVLDGYPKRNGYLLQLFRVFANSLRFLRKGTLNLLDRDSPLTLRQREIVILRVCANNGCEYEWGVHVTAFASHAGLTAGQVAATVPGHEDSDGWNAEDSDLLRGVDELCAHGRMQPPTLHAFRRRFALAQQLEILALCGNYHTISFVANSADLEPEAFAAQFPDRRPSV